MESKKWYYRMPAKTAFFLILFINTIVLIAGIIGCLFLWDGSFYTMSKSAQVEEMVQEEARRGMYRIFSMGLDGELEEEPYYLRDSNYMYELRDNKGNLLATNYDGEETEYQYVYGVEELGDLYLNTHRGYELTVYIDDEFRGQDIISLRYWVIGLMYQIRYAIYPIVVTAALLMVICFVFLMCSAGHRAGRTEVIQSFLARVPLELYLFAIWTFCIFFPGLFVRDLTRYDEEARQIGILLLIVYAVPVLVGVCMNLAVRVKCGVFWKNTVIQRAFCMAKRLVSAVWGGVGHTLQALPFVWKSVLGFVAVIVVEFFVLMEKYWNGRYDTGMSFLVMKMLELAVFLYLVMLLKRLKKGGEELAGGDLSYQIDERGMVLEFREHAKNLNSIAEGMNTAVNERMKSERMKTELITNVSHDIKTPLTSIVNYSDLIAKEHSENEKINEYAQVLERQSTRLKKLIEDLVEASKASTGNLEVVLEPMEIGVMLVQVTGEYTERLKEKNLTLIAKQPDEPIPIMADGRRLWRVIDNLFNNVCKYSQEGTRVYLTVEQKEGQAVITLKNTSKYALDIPAEELMGRFVRGDEARSTEGNGLGLSIAQSLTELQKGTMELIVDGDLFKVVLRFPVLA